MLQQPKAACFYISPGGVKVAGIPRISHIAGVAGVFQEKPHSTGLIAATDPVHIPQIFAVHAD